MDLRFQTHYDLLEDSIFLAGFGELELLKGEIFPSRDEGRLKEFRMVSEYCLSGFGRQDGNRRR